MSLNNHYGVRRRALLAAAASALLATMITGCGSGGSLTPQLQAPSYRAVALNSAGGGGRWVFADLLNDAGQVAGRELDSSGNSEPVAWDSQGHERMLDPGSPNSFPAAQDRGGRVLVAVMPANPDPTNLNQTPGYLLVDQAGNRQPLPALQGFAVAMNQATVVGTDLQDNGFSFDLAGNTNTPLATQPGYLAAPMVINQAGEAAGALVPASILGGSSRARVWLSRQMLPGDAVTPQLPAVWRNGVVTVLPTTSGNGQVVFLDDQGVALGQDGDEWVSWDANGQEHVLLQPSANATWLVGIDGKGRILGNQISGTPGGFSNRPFLLVGGQMRFLDGVLPRGVSVDMAVGLNQAGQILIQGNTGGKEVPYLLQPQ